MKTVFITSSVIVVLTMLTSQSVQAQRFHSQVGTTIHHNFQSFQPQPPVVQPQWRGVSPRGPFVDATGIFGLTGVINRFGVLIQSIVPGSSACQAGLQVGDAIVRVEGRRIECLGDWNSAVNSGGGRPTFHVFQPGRSHRKLQRIVVFEQRPSCPIGNNGPGSFHRGQVHHGQFQQTQFGPRQLPHGQFHRGHNNPNQFNLNQFNLNQFNAGSLNHRQFNSNAGPQFPSNNFNRFPQFLSP